MDFNLGVTKTHPFNRLSRGTVTITTNVVGLTKIKEPQNIGATTRSTDSTYFYLLDDLGDILLGLWFQCDNNKVVVYHKPANGQAQDREERHDLKQLFGPPGTNQRAKILVKYAENKFNISINGNFLFKYTNTFAGHPCKIAYKASQGMTPLFGQVVDVNVTYLSSK